MPLPQEMHPRIQGDGTIAAIGDVTIWAAPGAGNKAFLTHAVVTVTVAAATALIAIEDGVGGTVICKVDAAATGAYEIDFGPWGYELTINTLLNLTNETANATAFVTAVGYYKKV